MFGIKNTINVEKSFEILNEKTGIALKEKKVNIENANIFSNITKCLSLDLISKLRLKTIIRNKEYMLSIFILFIEIVGPYSIIKFK